MELFLTPLTYCDVATLGELCSTTGGQLHLFPNYKVRRNNMYILYVMVYWEWILFAH